MLGSGSAAFVVRNLDDGKQVEGYEESGVRVYKSEARIADPGRVDVDGEVLETDRLIVATGSDAKVPPIPGLEEPALGPTARRRR